MATLLLDSSVLVKWFLPESDAHLALTLQQAFLAGRLTLAYADLALCEVANALHFSNLFDPNDIVGAIEAIRDLGMIHYPYDSQAFAMSIQYAKQYRIAIYDSYLVALAQLHQLTFVTADQRLVKQVVSLAFIYDLAAYPI